MQLTADDKKRLLWLMLTIRHFELTVQEKFFQGHIPGFAHIYVGEEATAVGVCAALKQDDYIVSTHRGHAHCIAKGGDIKRLMAELYGKADGYCRGRGGSMHIFAKEIGVLGTTGIVGGGLPLALGAGLHAKLRKTGQVSVCFFGDGAANQGTFHESINLAAIQKLPVIFVCENNLYATETAVSEATLTKDFAARAEGYGIPGIAVDGNNVLEVYEKTFRAIDRARTGDGPALLECKTYRHFGHYVGHAETGYRTKEEIESWKGRDPIKLFSKYLMEHNLMDEKAIKDMEESVKLDIEDAVKFAIDSPFPEPEKALEYVFT
jgi:TPP-dependent pyruvate/acetoin dehydrogenase alpha subunit